MVRVTAQPVSGTEGEGYGVAVTTGAPRGWATLGGGLCPGVHHLSCRLGPGPQADQGLALRWGCKGQGGGAMSAVLAPFMAATTEEEVGCLWSWGQGAHRRMGVLSALHLPAVSVHGGSGAVGL